MSTGIEFPAEASGTLRPPGQWSSQSKMSMAMGYEVAVTPLQLAVGYAVFANGGKLVEPTLIKEIRAPDGSVKYRHTPRMIRRVISEDVAAGMRAMLKEVVESGTAKQASLGTYVLAGKTGTPRGTVNGRYVKGFYNPNFVGMFPADDPQYVIAVRISNPEGANYYGGRTAAPVTREVIEAAVASPQMVLDRGRLAATAKTPELPEGQPARLTVADGAQQAGETLAGRPAAEGVTSPGSEVVVITLPAVREEDRSPPAQRVVPDVRGMSLRDAVRTLHSAGFRVGYFGRAGGRITSATFPAAGAVVRRGTLIRLNQ
jgi:cell division protein FtsI (penicillin-binding protein 3)